MPILFMALIALAVFLIMGAMVFYAAYAESHTPPEEEEARLSEQVKGGAAPHAAGKAVRGN